MKRTNKMGATTFLIALVGMVLVLSVIEWQLGLFFGALATAFVAAGWPLAIAARLVSLTWQPDWVGRGSWKRFLLLFSALLIALVVAYVSHTLSQLVVEIAPDSPESPIGVASAGAGMGLFTLALASITVVPLCLILSATAAAIRRRRRAASAPTKGE